MKILIIEDDRLLAEALETLLEIKGLRSRPCTTARTGRNMPRPAFTTC